MDDMLAHEKKPLMNKALRGQYAPGSTFKMLVALAALEEKLITPDEKMLAIEVYEFGGGYFTVGRATAMDDKYGAGH